MQAEDETIIASETAGSTDNAGIGDNAATLKSSWLLKISNATKDASLTTRRYCEANRTLIARLVVVIYFGTFWIWSFSLHGPYHITFFAYLTNWGWTLEFIYFCYSLVADFAHRFPSARSLRNVTIGQQATLQRKLTQQMLAELVFVAQIVIVLFYWAVVFPQADIAVSVIWWNLQFHGMGLLLILIDYAYRNIRGFSLQNHKYIIFFGVLYFLCHIAVVAYSGKPIYPGINFKDARSFIITLAALSTLVFTHKLVYVLVHWKSIKNEVNSAFQIAKVVLLRSDSFDVSPMHFLWNKLHQIKIGGLRSRAISQISFVPYGVASTTESLQKEPKNIKKRPPLLKRRGSF